jgi:hypothetical protein
MSALGLFGRCIDAPDAVVDRLWFDRTVWTAVDTHSCQACLLGKRSRQHSFSACCPLVVALLRTACCCRRKASVCGPQAYIHTVAFAQQICVPLSNLSAVYGYCVQQSTWHAQLI